jgi:iron complex outermembrane receptor protein
VFGGYVDIETDITDKLLLNGAGRYEHYSDYGSSFAGKFAFVTNYSTSLQFGVQ